MTERYNIESFLIVCDSNVGYIIYTYDNDEYVVTLEAIGERTVEPIPTEESEETFNYYSRSLASLGTFYQSFYLDANSGEVVGNNHRVQLEGLDTYVKAINTDETSITYKDKIVNGSINVNNGIVYVEWPTNIIDVESEEKIDIQLSYISCVPLVLEQNYIVEISGETINTYHGVWECKEQSGLLYLGDFDPFMGTEEDPEEPGPSALELLPVEGKNNLFYTNTDYFIDYVEDSTTRYKIDITGNILGEISDVKSSKGVVINNIDYFYIGNLFLFTEDQSDDTEEDYLFLSSGAGTETSESKLYICTSEAETIELLIDFDELTEIKELEGAALLSFGRDTPDEHNSLNNYGIAINSSDDFLALPQRAISLFETQIRPNELIKVDYRFRGIFGTLPGGLPVNSVSPLYFTHMEGTQGIYTDNMYLGDKQQYLAFYTDKNTHQKKLRITGADIYLTYNDEQSDNTLIDVIDGIEVGDGLFLIITSSAGTEFNTSNIETTLTAHLYKDGEEVLPEGVQTAEEVINNLGYQVNWYNYTTTETLIKSNSMTLIVGLGANDDISATDSIEIIAKLEDFSNSQGE